MLKTSNGAARKAKMSLMNCFTKMSNALEPNQTLEHLDLGNTELLANHIDTLTSQLRHPNPESNGHRQVVGDESISLLGKRMEREY